ncbi:MAG: sigma 54-interacting transcriptional regulator [Paludibacteraceae bacterium]|nr:sigma 54-interacting transcriptional regulator [Paludibacteraceae bacterium]
MSEETLQEIKNRFGIIGNDVALNRAIERAYLVASTDYAILVTGESGVGKENFPKIVHAFSPRKHQRYFAINCGAIPNGTIDSELFGHVKGAFTGAVNDHKGYFEQADGGTIFLDEVGELPLETQVRLLRVLETGEYIRVGGSEVQKTNVRVVAATNLNMAEAIDNGKFREDLYYRLSTISIHVPSLRERKDDIPLLFRKFAMDCTEKYKMPPVRLTPEAVKLLQNYYFRGNIRQLKNITEQLCVLERKREITPDILAQYLPEEGFGKALALTAKTPQDNNYATEREILFKVMYDLKREIDELKQTVSAMQQGNTMPLSPKEYNSQALINTALDKSSFASAEVVADDDNETDTAQGLSHLQKVERDMIEQSLQKNKGNRKLTAAEVGLSERTLYRKIREYGL